MAWRKSPRNCTYFALESSSDRRGSAVGRSFDMVRDSYVGESGGGGSTLDDDEEEEEEEEEDDFLSREL